MNNNSIQDKKSLALPILFFMLGIAYAINPIDIIPDFIPVAGQIDDVFATGIPSLHLIQKILENSILKGFAPIVKFTKWIAVILGVIAVGIILLLGVSIINLIKNW